MCYMLCVCPYSNKETVLSARLSSGWATAIGRLLGPKTENSIKCLAHGHSDVLPRRLGGDRMVGPLGVVVSQFRPTSQIEGRGPHHHVEAARRWCITSEILLVPL